MLQHQVLNGLFNESSCNASKQLTQVRSELFQCSYEPSFVIILPPPDLINRSIDADTFFADNYLLAHVTKITKDSLATVNGPQWTYKIADNHVIPDNGFGSLNTNQPKILKSYFWQPGLQSLRFDATYMIIEVDDILLHPDIVKKTTWFNSKKSMPLYLENPNLLLEVKGADSSTLGTSGTTTTSTDTTPLTTVRNPACNLGKNRSQTEQNMAKVDYSLACLQTDVLTPVELAERYHKCVNDVRISVIRSGGLVIDMDTSNDTDVETDTVPLNVPKNAIPVSKIYDYAESKLGRNILSKLDELLPKTLQTLPFTTIHADLKNLDITQVDIPDIQQSNIPMFERAVAKASSVLNRLADARNTRTMCTILLSSINELSTPELGTVSADTLIGLFMLSFLRCSVDFASVLERNLYFVTHFSYMASSNADSDYGSGSGSASGSGSGSGSSCGSALGNLGGFTFGKLSYTLMVVESVVMQLKMEYHRLKTISANNSALWKSVRDSRFDDIKQYASVENTSLISRKNGKSALFLAAEDHNSEALKYLFSEFPNVFTKEHTLHDKDMLNRTLLMIALPHFETVKLITDVTNDPSDTTGTPRSLGEDYFDHCDKEGNNVGHYLSRLQDPKPILDLIGDRIPWTKCNMYNETPIIAFAVHKKLHFVVKYVKNFYDHFDTTKNSLLHYAVNDNDILTVQQLMQLPSTSLDTVNEMMETPLTLANRKRRKEMIEVLLSLGANPWFIDDGTPAHVLILRARSGTRYSVSSDNGLSFASHTDGHKLITATPTNVYKKTIDSIIKFKTILDTKSPYSWVPPLFLPIQYPTTCLEGLFHQESVQDLNTALESFLFQVRSHSTLSQSLNEFLNSELDNSEGQSVEQYKEQDKEQDNHKSFGDESVESIAMFFGFGHTQLNKMMKTLCVFTRLLAVLNNQQELYTNFYDLFVEELGVFSTQHIAPFRTISRRFPPANFNRKVQLSFDLIASFIYSLSMKLTEPNRFILAHKDTCFLLSEQQMKLNHLKAQNPKPAWLNSLEEKRQNEIRETENSVSLLCVKRDELLEKLRNIYFYLASDLSTFNESQEADILNQIKSYTRVQISRERDQLKQLQHGWRFNPPSGDGDHKRT